MVAAAEPDAAVGGYWDQEIKSQRYRGKCIPDRCKHVCLTKGNVDGRCKGFFRKACYCLPRDCQIA
uniref:Knottins-like domain-containing protein n=1 Tax=Kalanchoe fedtschenkoi TaxID=63787 RepID=A0A7N0UTY2_KALFE